MARRILLVESGPHISQFWEKTLAKAPLISLAEMERYLIENALNLSEGNQTGAARRLGISRFALRNRMRRYGIQKPVR